MGRVSLGTKVYQELDDILTFLVLSVDDSHKGWRLPLRNFNYADIMNDTLAPSLSENSCRVDMGIFGDVHPNDLDGQWDVATVTHVEGEDRARYFGLSRFRRIPLKAARGFPVRSPYLGEYSGAIVDSHDGTFRTERSLVQLVGGKWQYLECAYVPANYSHFRLHSKFNHNDFVDLNEKLQCFLGMQFTRYYQWRVAVGLPGTISLTFPTDPTGIKAIFKMRDVPEGLQRRAMLKNWVSEHTRQCRASEDDFIWVRQHLRGHLQFSWLGFTCEVMPSQDAIDKNIELAWLKERNRHR
jgi:hypothetical protein